MRCGSGGTPAGAFAGGKVQDPVAVGTALKQLLARTEITETRAMIAASDAVATFRVLRFPRTTTDQEVDSAITKVLPLDPERMATRWVDLHTPPMARLIYAAAWDRALVKRITDAAKVAGLEAMAVDLKSACVARAVAEPSCVVVDLNSDPIEIFLIDGSVPQLWHSVHLQATSSDDLAAALAVPLRSVLRFFKRSRDHEFGPRSPILISAEQVLPTQVGSRLSELVDHPVELLRAPARVPPEVRHNTYLPCLGLIMRRTS
jgi:hypothetical protein